MLAVPGTVQMLTHGRGMKQPREELVMRKLGFFWAWDISGVQLGVEGNKWKAAWK